MGHQLAHSTAATAVVAAALVVAGCGGGGDEELPPVLDNARQQVEATEDAATDDAEDAADTADLPDELPPPDPSEYEGANRIVNLWVGPGGDTRSIDVWGRRTFTNGPILLAENVEFGASSDYFGAPPGYSIVAVGSGAGPDGDELAGLFNAIEGEQIMTIFTNDDDLGTVAAPSLWELDPTGTFGAPARPDPGTGVVFLYAPNTRSFGDSMVAALGSDAFYVGDASTTCRRQRVEDAGFQANVLGGTQDVQIQAAPGPATISLHAWPSADECAQTPVAQFTVDVVADRTQMVLVYTPDGATLDTLTLPVG